MLEGQSHGQAHSNIEYSILNTANRQQYVFMEDVKPLCYKKKMRWVLTPW